MTTAPTDEVTSRLYLAVGRLARALRGGGSKGLGHGSVSALATLTYGGPMRQGDLAAREGVAAPTLSRIVASLVDSGHVRRDPDPNDGRVAVVAATEKGEQVVAELRSTRLHELQRRLDRLSDERRTAIIAALPALEELLVDEV